VALGVSLSRGSTKTESKDVQTTLKKESDTSGEARASLPPNELLVIVSQGRDLVVPSGNISKQSGVDAAASVVLICNEQVIRTDAQVQTGSHLFLWEESHRFVVSNVRKSLVATIEHHDPINGDSIIGRVTVQLKALEDGRDSVPPAFSFIFENDIKRRKLEMEQIYTYILRERATASFHTTETVRCGGGTSRGTAESQRALQAASSSASDGVTAPPPPRPPLQSSMARPRCYYPRLPRCPTSFE